MQVDDHVLTVCRYVERNAVRANLVAAAEAWPWGSPWQRITRTPAVTLDECPVPPPRDWLELVNRPQTDAELEAVRRAVVTIGQYYHMLRAADAISRIAAQLQAAREAKEAAFWARLLAPFSGSFTPPVPTPFLD